MQFQVVQLPTGRWQVQAWNKETHAWCHAKGTSTYSSLVNANAGMRLAKRHDDRDFFATAGRQLMASSPFCTGIKFK
jgi:hypothetical protein